VPVPAESNPGGGPATRLDPSPSKAVLVYNVLRLLLLAVALGIGYLAGLRGLFLIVVALLVSGVASWFLLQRFRVGMGIAVERSIQRSRAAFAGRASAEDAADEAARSNR
jgi:hypothetical protein